MSSKDDISVAVIRRLPRYYRFLGELKKAGVVRVSSRELSERLGLTASQIRQDFNRYGGFGHQGYGYNVEKLHEEIGKILGLHYCYTAILIGSGNLGRAVANHVLSEQGGFELIGIFDKKESLTGQMIREIPIRHVDGLDEFCRENRPKVAIMCLPEEAAKELTPQLIDMGITSFWNFSSYDILLDYPDVLVENVHIGDSLMTLCYKITW
ncbi:MAG: redox-sensing transcriptional repressor Rex [Clostridia bacterium]|nr:redox-sensing transcriptional repressor Rex [Clostridia bacterium]